MQFIVLFLATIVTVATSKTPFRHIKFVSGYRHLGGFISSEVVTTRKHCAMLCVFHNDCNAVNFELSSGDAGGLGAGAGGGTCELLTVTGASLAHVTAYQGWTFAIGEADFVSYYSAQ